MTVMNNVNVTALEQIAGDRSRLKRTQVIQGDWLLAEGGPQFRAELAFEGGKVVLEADQPKNLGGGGSRPGPLHYCFFGLTSCYTATFAAMCAQLGIELRRLSARLEGDLDFSLVFGLSSDPVMREVRIALTVESDAPREKLQEAERLAHERCPAVYALTHQVKLSTRLEVA